MFHDRWKLMLVISLMALQLPGCIRLHNEGTAKTTAGMKETYAKLDVPGVIEVEKKNLANLLSEELKTVRDNQQLQVDLALLQMADGNSSMYGMLQEAQARIKRLGFDDFKGIKAGVMNKVDEDSTRKIADEFGQRLQRQLLRNNITNITCDTVDTRMKAFDNISTNKRVNEAMIRINYAQYKAACGKLQGHATYGGTAQSSIQAAFRDWSTAKMEAARKKQAAEEAKKEFEDIQKKCAQAVKVAKDAGKSGDELEAEIRKAAKTIADAVEKVGKVSPVVAAELRLAAVVEVLTAAATGKEKAADTSTAGSDTDPNVQAATLIAMTMPSLAGDMKELIMKAKAPSVSSLLMEMKHQMVQLEYEKQLLALDEERVDLHKAKYDALFGEAGYWNRFNDALCSYAVLSGGGKHPGGYCNEGFTVEADGAICSSPAGKITGCVLARPWHENLRDVKLTAAMCKADNKAKICSSYEAKSLEACKRFEDKKQDINQICSKNEEATRELYKAIIAYLGTLAEQAKAVEKDFSLIDVSHRETLAGRRAALLGWDNLVGVPIDQLDASGILSAQLNRLSLTYSQLAELRAENIAQLHAANTAIRARYVYDLELTRKSGGQDNLKFIDEIEEWQQKVNSIFISSGETEKQQKEAILSTQTKLDTKAESLNSIAQTLASLAKAEPFKERAKFMGLYAKSMKDEMDKQLAKDEVSSKEAKSLLEEVKQQIKN